MGGKGERLAQCSRVRVVTTKAIPMQVDGEPCLLAPSHILVSFHSKVSVLFSLATLQVPMLRREKRPPCTPGLKRRIGSPKSKVPPGEASLTSTSLIMQLPVRPFYVLS